MAHGAPDYVTRIEVAVTVEIAPGVYEVITPPAVTNINYYQAAAEAAAAYAEATAASEFALDTFGSYSGFSAVLQDLFNRTVPASRTGLLNSIELSCDNYAVAIWYIKVKGVVILDNEKLPSSFTKEFPGLHLLAGEQVLVQVKSDGATTINTYADANYKEIG